MDLFSSSAEETLRKQISVQVEDFSDINDHNVSDLFELKKCLQVINDKQFSKICLQFPDNLLQFSIQVALWLEKETKQNVFILGDTTFGSCCVDEVAAEHVEGDVVIHFGHTCLSPSARLPVVYVLPKASLDLSLFTLAFSQHASTVSGHILLLYDVAYCHLSDKLREGVACYKDKVVVSQLCVPESEHQPCSPTCQLLKGNPTHQQTLLGRAFCCSSPSSIVYVSHKHTQNMLNFALLLKDIPFLTFNNQPELKLVDSNKKLRQRLFLVEKIKDAKTIGIIAGTLSMEKFLGAINQVKRLAEYRGKKCYIFSVGKPNPAKLANFPEIEVFVLVSCPEACLENEKEFMQPVVTLIEAELALNPNRQWDDHMSTDFRDLLDGGCFHKPIPEGQEPLATDMSLISNKIRSGEVEVLSQTSFELASKEHYQISVASSYSSQRSWKGLEQALGETAVSQVTVGRSGIPLGYDNEKTHSDLL